MTLLVQTDTRVQQRKERRREARAQLLRDEVTVALDTAVEEVERMQAPLMHVVVGSTGPPAAAPADPSLPPRLPFGVPGFTLDGGDPGVPAAPVDAAAAMAPIMSDSRTRVIPVCMAFGCLCMRIRACIHLGGRFCSQPLCIDPLLPFHPLLKNRDAHGFHQKIGPR